MKPHIRHVHCKPDSAQQEYSEYQQQKYSGLPILP
jgi:hypothetical protein